MRIDHRQLLKTDPARACGGVNTDIVMDSIAAPTVFNRCLEGSEPSVEPPVFLVARDLEKPTNSV